MPIAGLFTIKFNGIEFEKLKKKISDRPTNTCKTGSAKGKQNCFKVGISDKWFTLQVVTWYWS